jgi:hypothetical protein
VFSQPWLFSFAPTTRILRVVVKKTSYYTLPDELEFDVRWTTNVLNVVLEARILRRGSTVGRMRTSEETLISLDPDNTSLTWRRPRRVPTPPNFAAGAPQAGPREKVRPVLRPFLLNSPQSG